MERFWWFTDTFWAPRTTQNAGICTGGILIDVVLLLLWLFCFWGLSINTHTASSRSAETISPFNRRCLSCNFKCSYVDVSFSHNMQYFSLNCKGERPLAWICSQQQSWERKSPEWGPCSLESKIELVPCVRLKAYIVLGVSGDPQTTAASFQLEEAIFWLHGICHKSTAKTASRERASSCLTDRRRRSVVSSVLLFIRFSCFPQRHCHFFPPLRI